MVMAELNRRLPAGIMNADRPFFYLMKHLLSYTCIYSSYIHAVRMRTNKKNTARRLVDCCCSKERENVVIIVIVTSKPETKLDPEKSAEKLGVTLIVINIARTKSNRLSVLSYVNKF